MVEVDIQVKEAMAGGHTSIVQGKTVLSLVKFVDGRGAKMLDGNVKLMFCVGWSARQSQ